MQWHLIGSSINPFLLLLLLFLLFFCICCCCSSVRRLKCDPRSAFLFASMDCMSNSRSLKCIYTHLPWLFVNFFSSNECLDSDQTVNDWQKLLQSAKRSANCMPYIYQKEDSCTLIFSPFLAHALTHFLN